MECYNPQRFILAEMRNVMEQIYKYPRTRHIEGSRMQAGDEGLKNVPFEEIKGQYIVLEEKVDGANSGISFDEAGKMYLQSRGHYLNGGYGERQFDLFKTWAGCYQKQLFELLKSRYIMYGEWLYAKHTVYYDALPHYFMEFDIFDKREGMFLSTKRRRELLKPCEFIHSVLVLYEGCLNSMDELTGFLGRSYFKTADYEEHFRQQCERQGISWEMALKQTDMSDKMEGIYIKTEDNDRVIDRLKYVRGSFLNTILDSETHWMKRPILPNELAEGRNLFI